MQLRRELDEGLLLAGNGEAARRVVKPELLLGPAEQLPEQGVVQERHRNQVPPPLDVPDVDSDVPVRHVGARSTVVVMAVPSEERLQLRDLLCVGNNGWQAKKTHDQKADINLQALCLCVEKGLKRQWSRLFLDVLSFQC